jgi:hypothetical protein
VLHALLGGSAVATSQGFYHRGGDHTEPETESQTGQDNRGGRCSLLRALDDRRCATTKAEASQDPADKARHNMSPHIPKAHSAIYCTRDGNVARCLPISVAQVIGSPPVLLIGADILPWKVAVKAGA